MCVLAGFGAGLGIGFAGLSAAVYISPMLVAWLNIPVYDAVGIALASDVLASAMSAMTYAAHGNFDMKRGKPLMIIVLIFTVIGSIFAYFVTSYETGNNVLGYYSIFASLIMGIWFLIKPYAPKKEFSISNYTEFRKQIFYFLSAGTGFICGFQGTGGGMMLLFILTVVMEFDFKPAVGTSVFIMAPTALTGAILHFINLGGIPNTEVLLLCMFFTTVFAQVGSFIANKTSQKKLKLAIGILLTISSLLMLAAKIWL